MRALPLSTQPSKPFATLLGGTGTPSASARPVAGSRGWLRRVIRDLEARQLRARTLSDLGSLDAVQRKDIGLEPAHLEELRRRPLSFWMDR